MPIECQILSFAPLPLAVLFGLPLGVRETGFPAEVRFFATYLNAHGKAF